MENKTFRKYYLFSLLGVLLASCYPIYMGISVIVDMIRYGTVYAENYPKDYPEPESVVAILRKKKKVTELPVIMREREEGTSSIAGPKSAYYMIKVTLAIFMEILRR